MNNKCIVGGNKIFQSKTYGPVNYTCIALIDFFLPYKLNKDNLKNFNKWFDKYHPKNYFGFYHCYKDPTRIFEEYHQAYIYTALRRFNLNKKVFVTDFMYTQWIKHSEKYLIEYFEI